MTPTQVKIVAAVEDAGGSASWQQVMDALEYPERGTATKQIHDLEAKGILKRVVSFSSETGTSFTVDMIVPVEEVPVEEGG